jgi:hypothetical protein
MTTEQELIALREELLERSQEFPTAKFERDSLQTSKAPNPYSSRFPHLEAILTRVINDGTLTNRKNNEKIILEITQIGATEAARIVTQINWGGIPPR